MNNRKYEITTGEEGLERCIGQTIVSSEKQRDRIILEFESGNILTVKGTGRASVLFNEPVEQ